MFVVAINPTFCYNKVGDFEIVGVCYHPEEVQGMIDFTNIEKYRENNRIEAKKALGGLPKSLWETYSAFANALGGVILLGVEEYRDKSLHVVNLPDPEALVREFWDIVNNPMKVSVNILADKHVRIQEQDGKRFIAITVPRAQRFDKPIYIDGNPLTGTYRRNGEGDYKCTKDEVQAMLRDAAVKTQDMKVLEQMGLEVFDYDSIQRYRQRMQNHRPAHVWEELNDNEFLYKLGAVGRSEDGKMHPTAAGLLMFGYEYEIVKEFPNYFLDYQEQEEANVRWTDRVVSSSGDWSGNLYDFYFKVYNRLVQNVKVPFKLEMGERVDDTPVHGALREALANCIINADYYGTRGLVIIKKKDVITISNPGGFRIDMADAKSGGISDPRNTTLIKMFNMINIGERAGSGIPNIYKTWEKLGWKTPVFLEEFAPDRITLSLDVSADKCQIIDTDSIAAEVAIKSGDKKVAIKDGDKKTAIKTEAHKDAIVAYLTGNVTAKTSELMEVLNLKQSRVRKLLSELVEADIVVAEGNNKNRVYKLKA